MATIITGLASDWKVPGVYINVELGRGTPSAAMEARKELIIGNMLSTSEFPAGTYMWDENSDVASVDGLYQVPDLKTAVRLFGYGSELYLMASAAFKAYANVDLWAYVQGEVDDVGTNRTVSWNLSVVSDPGSHEEGYITISILDKTCRVKVVEDMPKDAVVLAIKDAFNAQLRELPYYCKLDDTTTPDEISFRAKHPGLIWTRWNGVSPISVDMDFGDTNVEIEDDQTVPQGPPFIFKDGDGEYNLETGAFADGSPLQTRRFHYVVVATQDGGNLSDLETFLTTQADPLIGFRQQGVLGSVKDWTDTLALATASGRNPRVQCVWAEGNSYYPGQLAAATAATRAKLEGSDPAANMCLQQILGLPQTDEALIPIATDKRDAINEGVTALVPGEQGMVMLRSVTMAAKADTHPVLDTHKVTVSDFLADDIQIKMASRYKGFKLSPDTDKPIPSKVTTPSRIKAALMEWLRVHEKAGRITRVTELSDEVRVEMDEEVPGRVNFQIPEDVIEIFAVGAGNIIQIG